MISTCYGEGWFIYALFHNWCEKLCFGFYSYDPVILRLPSKQSDGILCHPAYLKDSLCVYEMGLCGIVRTISLLMFLCMSVLLNLIERGSALFKSCLFVF
jgi:hypothetical protein